MALRMALGMDQSATSGSSHNMLSTATQKMLMRYQVLETPSYVCGHPCYANKSM